MDIDKLHEENLKKVEDIRQMYIKQGEIYEEYKKTGKMPEGTWGWQGSPGPEGTPECKPEELVYVICVYSDSYAFYPNVHTIRNGEKFWAHYNGNSVYLYDEKNTSKYRGRFEKSKVKNYMAIFR